MGDLWAGLSEAFRLLVTLRRSVLKNLIYPLQMRGVLRASATKQANDWAVRVGMDKMQVRNATILPGGEQQKLALARAMREIEIVILAARARGTQLALSTHDLGQGRRLADEVIFMLHGRVHEHASAPSFFDAPETVQAQAFLRGDIVE